MNLLFLVIFMCCDFFKTQADVGDDEKYIDLLPEAEKQAFLDHVARRLEKEVKIKDVRYSDSREIPNDELDEHDDFVKKILAEESNNLRRQRNNKENDRDSNEALKVKARNEQNADSKKKYIDLTLREGSRAKRLSENNLKLLDNDSITKTDYIPVKVLYGSDNNTEFSKTNNIANIKDEKKKIHNVIAPNTASGDSANSNEKDIQVRSVRRISNQERSDPDSFTKIDGFNPDEDDASKEQKDNSEEEDITTATSRVTKLDQNSFTASIYETEESESSNETISNETNKNFKNSELSSTTETVTQKMSTRTTTTVTNKIEITYTVPLATHTDVNIIKNETSVVKKRYLRNGLNETTIKETEHLEINDNEHNSGEYSVKENTKAYGEVITSKNNDNDKELSEENVYAEIPQLNKNTYSNENISRSNVHTTQVFDLLTSTTEDVTEDPVLNEDVQKAADRNETTVETDNGDLNAIAEEVITNKNNDSDKELPEGNTYAETSQYNKNTYPNENISRSNDFTTQVFDLLTSTIENVTEDPVLNEYVRKTADRNETTVETNNVDLNVIATLSTNQSDLVYNATESIDVVGTVTTTAETPTITKHPGLESTAKAVVGLFDNLISINKTGTEKNITSKEVAVFDNLVKALRNGLQFQFENDEDEKKDVDLSSKPKPGIHMPKEYIVYEIPAKQPAFIKHSGKNQGKTLRTHEEPYYVPVYNYLPDKAYFNAYNRLGPNYDASNEDLFKNLNKHEDENTIANETFNKDILRKFKFDSKRPQHIKRNHITRINNIDHKLKLPIVVKNPILTDMYYNPNDYLDMDYYLGRMGSPYEQSYNSQETVLESPDEMYNPYSKMNIPTAKGYLSEIRRILIENQAFGLFGKRSTTKAPTSLYKMRALLSKNNSDYMILLPDINLRNSFPEESDISIDYYFSLNREDEEKDSFRTKDTNRFIMNKNLKNQMKRHNRRIKRKIKQNKHANKINTKTGSIKELLALSDASDVFKNLEKLLKLKVPLGRRVEVEELTPFMNVIEDMVKHDNKALEQYDWLGTTVDILAAVEKMTNLIEISRKNQKMHPADFELLKYVQCLYLTAKATVVEAPPKESEELRETHFNKVKKNLLPKINMKRKSKKFLHAKGLIDRVWLYLRGRVIKKEKDKYKQLEELQKFLSKLQDALYDLHNAIKQIAIITKYNNQKWFKNLKELYIRGLEKKYYLELLIHISAARLLDLIEDSAKDLNNGYLRYIEEHQEEVNKSKEEFVFLMKVLVEVENK